MKKTVLIVEDEASIRAVTVSYFKQNNFTVLEAKNGKEAIEVFQDNNIDLVILDVMLPMLDGWTVLKKIRKQSDVLIIMLTALEDEDDKLSGFELGADEYVTKPFSPKVLIARANALIARSKKSTPKQTSNNNPIKIDKQSRKAEVDNKKLDLTPKEYIILEYLVDNINIALSREKLLNHVWGYDFYGDSRVVDNHIKNLRNKLGKSGNLIKTVIGYGYCLEI